MIVVDSSMWIDFLPYVEHFDLLVA